MPSPPGPTIAPTAESSTKISADESVRNLACKTDIPVSRDASRFNSSAASLQAGLPPSPLPPLTGTTAISEPKANIS